MDCNGIGFKTQLPVLGLLQRSKMRYNPRTMKNTNTTIAKNQKALFNYSIEETFEAGVVLEGWEVKALRQGKGQLTDGYVLIKNGELFMLGCQIMPLVSASTHVQADAQRTRKLLMARGQIERLVGKVEQKGFALVPLDLHWRNGRVKCTVVLGKGKGDYDKRATVKEREGKREVERAMKTHLI